MSMLFFYLHITKFDEIISTLLMCLYYSCSLLTWCNMWLNSGWELLGVIQPSVIFWLTPSLQLISHNTLCG